MEPAVRPVATSSRRLAADYTVVPVWTELLADLETPVAAFAKLVGDGPGSCSSRSSTASGGVASRSWARPAATLMLRDGGSRSTARCPSACHRPGDPGRARGAAQRLTGPVLPDLPPLHGGVMGFLGYDVIREVERLPDVPHDDLALPDAVMSVIGSLAAFDHWRQRVYLIESVPTHGRRPHELDAVYDAPRRPSRRVDRSRPAAAVRAGRPPDRRRLPRSARRCRAGCTRTRWRWPRSTSSPATSSRSCSPSATTSTLDADPFDVYRVLRQVNPSPYMYFLRHPEITVVGSSPEPMVQVLAAR